MTSIAERFIFEKHQADAEAEAWLNDNLFHVIPPFHWICSCFKCFNLWRVRRCEQEESRSGCGACCRNAGSPICGISVTNGAIAIPSPNQPTQSLPHYGKRSRPIYPHQRYQTQCITWTDSQKTTLPNTYLQTLFAFSWCGLWYFQSKKLHALAC